MFSRVMSARDFSAFGCTLHARLCNNGETEKLVIHVGPEPDFLKSIFWGESLEWKNGDLSTIGI